jgi:signal transduction histidine kinase
MIPASERLAWFLQTAQMINSSLELEVVLRHILTQATEVLQAEGGSVMLMDEATHQLRVLEAQGPRARKVRGKRQELGKGIAGWVAQSGTPLLLLGSTFDERFERVCQRMDVRDSLCVPLKTEGRVLGVLSLNNRQGQGPFSQDDLELLEAVSNHAALAVRNARTYEEAQRQRQTVERLLQELTRAQEEERKRISLLLHDGPAQTMFAALRTVQAATAMIEDPEALEAAMGSLEQILRQAIDETRAVMIDLRPLSMDEMGLFSSLRQYAQQVEKRTGIKTVVTRRGLERRLPEMVESCFYRIAQEALTNVWKHSEAQNVWLTLEAGARYCSLEIRDDGKGFDAEAVSLEAREHLGMSSLRDRAELAGGQLTLAGAPGQGTVVRVSVPLTEEGTSRPRGRREGGSRVGSGAGNGKNPVEPGSTVERATASA